MSEGLPPALERAIDAMLEGVSRGVLMARATAISARYREGGGSESVIRDGTDALAYTLTRLPATFAAMERALDEAARRAPGFAPLTMTDVGAGPGGASWAALTRWPSLRTAAFVDSNRVFLDLAARLGRADAILAEAQTRIADFRAPRFSPPPADLVLSSYALVEAPAREAGQIAGRLWHATQGLLVIVEPGTPAGFDRILSAREALIEAGADLLAPCPHAAACPMEPPAWCHFAVRLPRSRDHRLLKGASAPFEDEKFSYLAVARPGVAARSAGERVLSTPRIDKVEVAYRACTTEGLVDRRITRRDKAAFACARRLGWGDWFEGR